MPQITWDWVAGYFEGEGHIYWQDSRAGTKQGTGARCIVGQKEKAPQDALYKFLVGQGIEPVFYLRPASKAKLNVMSVAIWIVTVQRRPDVICFLKAIEGMLFQKRARALAVIGKLEALDKERDDKLSKALELKQAGNSWRDVARLVGIGRVALSNYARAAGIDLSRQAGFADSKSWRQDRVDRGLCESCGKERGTDGTKRKCRKCADAYNKKWNSRKRKH